MIFQLWQHYPSGEILAVALRGDGDPTPFSCTTWLSRREVEANPDISSYEYDYAWEGDPDEFIILGQQA